MGNFEVVPRTLNASEVAQSTADRAPARGRGPGAEPWRGFRGGGAPWISFAKKEVPERV